MKQRNYLEQVVNLQKVVLEADKADKTITEADKSLLVYLDWFYGSSEAHMSEIPKEDLKIIIDGLTHLVSVLENNEIADSVKKFVNKLLRAFRVSLDNLKKEYELDDVTREERLKAREEMLNSPDNPLKGFGTGPLFNDAFREELNQKRKEMLNSPDSTLKGFGETQ